MTMQKLKRNPQREGNARQAFPNQDTGTSNKMKFLDEVITRIRPERRLSNKIHETVLTIDSEMTTAQDTQYRQLLVKAAYALRNLEDWIQRPTYCPD